MCRHLSYDNLLCQHVPKIIDSEAAFGIACVSPILYVPIGSMALTLPVQIKLISAAMSIANTIHYDFVSQRALAAFNAAASAFVC